MSAVRSLGVIALVLGSVTATAEAKSWEDEDEPPPVHVPAPSVSPSSLAGLFGLPSLSAALKSNDARVRAAAVARAAEVALDDNAKAARDDAWRLVESAAADNGDDLDGALYVRLNAARALAVDPRREGRTALEGLLGSPEPMRKPIPPAYPAWGGPTWGGPWSPPTPAPPPKAIKPANADLVRFVRETAAMALGARGDHDPLLIRARARDNVEASRAAFSALIAYPAPSLQTLIPKNDASTINRDTVDLLARLNDMRAADVLVRVADGKDDVSAALAVIALARLGDTRAVRVARAVTSESRPELRIAAAEALGELGDPNGEGAIAALLADDKLGSEAKRLALKYPGPGLVGSIEKMARKGDAAAIAALGRAGAVSQLVSIAADDTLPFDAADAAAYQLAVIPIGGPLDQVDTSTAPRKRRFVRAGAVRIARIGSAPGALKSLAKELQSSKDAADRSAGTFFLGVSSLSSARDALASDDAVTRRAGAAALAAHPIADAAAAARAHLELHAASEASDIVQALAAIAARAVDGTVARDVPLSTSQLATWLSEDGPASPLAAFLLAARGGDSARAHIARALASDSLDVRAAAMLGLGVSPEKNATGELASRLSDTPHVVLRRAAVRALLARGDASGKSALDLARRLDPDLEVRNVAGAARVLARGTPLLAGHEVAQVRLKGKIATVTGLDGLTLPHVVDPDGFVFAFRVAPGPTRIEAR